MDRPIRIALVGRPNLLAACALEQPANGVAPLLVPVPTDGEPAAAVNAIRDGDVVAVVAFEPAALPAGLLDELDGPTIGWSLDPFLGATGLKAVDRLVVTGAAPPGADVWRSLPLPVADSCFEPPLPREGAPRGLWLCGDTARTREYRAHFSTTVELIHAGDDLASALGTTDIGVSLPDGEGQPLHHNAARSLAAGQLLVSQPIDPTRGLEPGLDFIEGRDLGDVSMAIDAAGADLRAFRRIRLRGRLKAERFRASKVYPGLVDDLMHDLRAFGR